LFKNYQLFSLNSKKFEIASILNRIRQFLPKIIEEIDNKTKECEDKLRRLGPSLPAESKDRM